MIVEILQWPDSQEVMDKPDWFFVMEANSKLDSGHPRYRPSILGDSAYARVLDDSEYILVEPTTADEHNRKQQEK